MKIRVTLKDPDTMQDSVDVAMAREPKPEGISTDEWKGIREDRAGAIKDDIADRWMSYGEYLVVEFDTEAGTATVIPNHEKP